MSLSLLGAYDSDSEASEPEEEKTDKFKNPFIISEDNDSSSDEETARKPGEGDLPTNSCDVLRRKAIIDES